MSRQHGRPVEPLEAFLASFGHEVRSPLHAIIGFAELLSDEAFGEINPEQHEVVGEIRSAAQHMLRVVSDVLDISRVGMHRLECQAEVLSLARLVQQAAQAAGAAAQERNIGFELAVPADTAICADERRVMQVLDCLLTNAIRYSPPGQTVRVTAEAEDGVVWTTVRDHGFGVAPADTQRIFEPFVGVKCGDAEPGPGLGLAVARALVETMGGQIEVAGSAGDGASFRFSLPRAQPPE